MPNSEGKKLVSMVKDPCNWYGKREFSKVEVSEKVFGSMEGDNHHLMRVDVEGETSFLGGYILGYSIRKGMGSKMAIEKMPFQYKYMEPFRFAQLMEIHPDVVPETFDTPRSRNRRTVERVQFNGDLVYRIPIRALAYLSLPVVNQQRMSELSSIDLVHKYRVTGDEKYLAKFLMKVKKEVGWIINRRFEVQKGIFGKDFLVAIGLEGAKQAFCRYDFSKEVKVETFMRKFVKGHILDFIRKDDRVPRLVRSIQGKIEDIIEDATQEGREVNLEELYEIFPERSRNTIDRAYGLATERGKDISLQTVIDKDHTAKCFKTRTLQDLTEDEHPSMVVDHAERLGNEELIEILLGKLNPHEKEIIVRYFLEEQTMKEVGNAIGISESKTSQMLPGIVRRMRIEAEKYAQSIA